MAEVTTVAKAEKKVSNSNVVRVKFPKVPQAVGGGDITSSVISNTTSKRTLSQYERSLSMYNGKLVATHTGLVNMAKVVEEDIAKNTNLIGRIQTRKQVVALETRKRK